MAKDQIASLAIDGEALEWTTARAVRGKSVVIKSGRVEGVVPAREGEVDPEQIKAAAQQLSSESGGIKSPVVVGLPAQMVLLRVIELPMVPDDELAGMVELQMDKISPFPVESMTVSHEVLRRAEGNCLVLVAAARSEDIDHIGARLAAVGLSLDRLDAAPLGWWRALVDAGEVPSEGRQLMLMLRPTAPGLIVFEAGTPVSFRALDSVGGLSEDELADELAREIDYTLMSEEMERGGADGCAVTVWRQGAMGEALAERLREEGSYAVHVKDIGALSGASAGLAARQIEGTGPLLDLTPRSWVLAQESRQSRQRLWTAAGILLGLWLVLVAGGMGTLYREESRLAVLKQRLAALQGQAMEVRGMRRRVVMLKPYEDRSDSALECLREICLHKPDGVDLSSFSYLKGEGLVKVSGTAGDVLPVFDFKRKLDASGLFVRCDLQGPRQDRSRRREVFDLDLKLKLEDE